MTAWIACVPNLSSGDAALIEPIAAAGAEVPGVRLLDTHVDPDHDRAILSFVGPPGAVAEAAFRVTAEAVERIDVSRHQGVHPRLGAADVVPFVPHGETTLQECSYVARKFAKRVEEELAVPTALYSAASTEGKTLPEIRREAPAGHPTAGVTCVGAREPLIAFNVDLESTDLELARRIAREMRLLPAVRALGFELASRGCVQVSMVLLNDQETSVVRAFREVARLAGDVAIRRSEIAGMIPRGAVEAGLVEAIRCRPLAVLDAAPTFLDRLAAADASPGGGAAAAYAGAMAAALVAMCTGFKGAELEDERRRAEVLRRELAELAERDAEEYARFRASGREEDLKRATAVPVFIAEKSAEVLLIAQRAGHKISKAAKPDLQGAMRLAEAALEQGMATARSNLGAIQDESFAAEVRSRLAGIP